ncbi:hypothetical protein AVEN_8008-1 [Araneus ventricosus]|uniref:Uncharacterized protein n=1 Tax=Araneus ventricosus TaxID=182803 RepID=A0A4Y2L0N5_ARAVE|nr:hypothetical protein AVEN_8008-1 [Araneus ventricosus]
MDKKSSWSSARRFTGLLMRLGFSSKHCQTKLQFSKEKHSMEEKKVKMDDEEEVDVPEEYNITVAQAKDAIHILRRVMECSENVEKEDFAAIFRIENLVEKQFEKRCLQVTVLDFLKKF